MSWLWTLIFLTFTLSLEAKHHAHKLPPAAASVVGTVYCDTCFHQDLPKPDHFITGATVAVECKRSSSSTPHFRQEVKTNSRGEFRVELPFSVGKHVKTIRGCSVALVRSSDPTCAAAAAATSSSLRLKSRTGKEQIFTAGLFTFKPQLCNQRQKQQKSVSSEKFFFLPPNPLNPGLLPPNPLLPPPALIPPVLPTPPPSLIPPVLPTPPSAPPSFPVPLPPIPGLAPPPSSSPQPTLPVPLPPLPMPLPPLPAPLPPLPAPLPPLPAPLPPLPMPLPPLPAPLPPLPTPLPPLPLPPVPVLPLPPVIPGGPPAKASPVRTTQP